MKPFLLCILAFCGTFLSARNIELNAFLFQAPTERAQKDVRNILKAPGTQKLFSVKMICYPGASSSVSLGNFFGYRKAGFQFKATPEIVKKNKKTTRFNAEFDWFLPSEGPFLAPLNENYYEGTIINGIRGILPDVFSPLGVNQSKGSDCLYIPALQFSKKTVNRFSVFTREKKWEITIKVKEDGKPEQVIRATPFYQRGKFPAFNPVGIECRMYNFRGVTVMNMYYCHQRGIRENGTPVTEELALSLCFNAPVKGAEILLADVTSFCFSDKAAFMKLPADGGKQIRYQVILTVK